MEVYQSLPEGTLAELINNVIYMSPSPAYNHQEVLIEIAEQLRRFLKLKNSGKLIVVPFDVYLDDTSNAVQPDIVVILNSNKGHLNVNGYFHGVPDLIVEILSPSNKDHDFTVKKNLYQRFGVKEYWIIDPQTKVSLGYSLENNQYVEFSNKIAALNSQLLSLKINF
jgi:Uma2 family endonuclease